MRTPSLAKQLKQPTCDGNSDVRALSILGEASPHVAITHSHPAAKRNEDDQKRKSPPG